MKRIHEILITQAEDLLRRIGVSGVPYQIGNSSMFVVQKDDTTYTEETTFMFAGISYKIGEKVSAT